MTSPPVFVFYVTLPNTFCHKIQTHSLLHMQFLLRSRTCNRPILPPKGYKIHLNCKFSVRTNYNSTLQQKPKAIASFQDPYLRMTSNFNLSLTLSRDIKILFKHDSSSRARKEMSAVQDRGSTNIG